MSENAEVQTNHWELQTMDEAMLDDKTKCTKKRTRNPEGWKRVRQKKARIAGKEYLNVRGHYVPARKIGPDCKCKLMCYKQVDESMRNMIFEGFYNLKSYDEQNAYLFGLIRKHDIKRKTNPNSARRTCTYKYYLRFRGREINVCKVAFARIHSISAKKIRGLCEKLDQNILFPKDGRGKHTNRPQKIQPETQELIRRHLYTLLRSADVRDYFKEDKNHPSSTELNITKLYKHFLLSYEPEALVAGTTTMNQSYMPRVKMWLYRSVFHQEFRTKEYQVLKKKLDSGYKQGSELEDYTLQDKVFTAKRGKRKGTRPQRKQPVVAENGKNWYKKTFFLMKLFF